MISEIFTAHLLSVEDFVRQALACLELAGASQVQTKFPICLERLKLERALLDARAYGHRQKQEQERSLIVS